MRFNDDNISAALFFPKTQINFYQAANRL